MGCKRRGISIDSMEKSLNAGIKALSEQINTMMEALDNVEVDINI